MTTTTTTTTIATKPLSIESVDGNDDDDGFQMFLFDNNYNNNNLNNNIENSDDNDGFKATCTTNSMDNYMQNQRRSTEGINNLCMNSAVDINDDNNDDNNMEIPLLNSRHQNLQNIDDTQVTPDNNTRCYCNQLGFGANRTSKSTHDARFRILLAIVICCMFMFIEFLGGFLAGSLAIMSDAAHLATDCISFFIGIVAISLGSRPPDAKMSFGYKRLEVMGAIVSILSIWMLTATLLVVAIERIFSADYYLDANTMMTISAIGILINILMAFILHGSSSLLPSGISAHVHSHAHAHAHSHSVPDYAASANVRTNGQQARAAFHAKSNGAMASLPQTDHFSLLLDTNGSSSLAIENGLKHTENCDVNDKHEEKNVNLRAALIHVIGDLVQSIGVFLAAVLIKFFPNAKIVDPLCTIFFSIIVIFTTVKLFKENMIVLLDAVPTGIHIEALKDDLLGINSVRSLHHLNVWNHTADNRVLMVHLVVDVQDDATKVLQEATKLVNSSKYNINHATIQIELSTATQHN